MTAIFRKLVQSGLTLAVVLTATFFLLRLAPGSPFDGDRVWPKEIQANIQKAYGLDQPLPVQFALWCSKMLRGDWGESFHYQGQDVFSIVWNAMGPSAILGVFALGFAIFVGIGLAILAVMYPSSAWSTFASVFGALGQSLPAYLVASVVILIFGVWLQWLPVALVETASGYLLPVFVLALRPAAWVVQLMRRSMEEQMQMDFVRYAYAKGLSTWAVVWGHVVRNASVGVLGIAGPLAANLLTGSFVVETVFQIPGLGKHFVTSVLNRDYPLIMGVTLTYGIILLSLNRFSEWLLEIVDPRIRPTPQGKGH